MTQKLALYFLAQGDGSPRVLDADHQPEYTNVAGEHTRGWTVGRSPMCAICFRNPATSKHHAVIRATFDKAASIAEGEPMYQWEIIDWPSTNGTFLESPGGVPYRIAPGVAYVLAEGAIVQFGSHDTRIKCSFDIDDTHGPVDDTDPSTVERPDRLPKETTGRTMADVVALVLTGPEGVDKRLWWALCTVVGVLIVYLLER